jgi:uncharacterized phage protein (TIGR02220 family)
MANRRMFAKSIIDTDYFLEMPATSQLLYFHLSMRADDDGFVASPKRILRMVGSSEDDFKMLIAKQFVIPFDSGVCVIKHWRIHNIIRSDRYQSTIYTKEKSMLIESENKSYELVHQNVIPDVIPTVNPVKVRLGKDSIGKDSIDKDSVQMYDKCTPEKEREKEIDTRDKIPYAEIISYLNEKTSSRYRNTESTKKLIRARMDEGFTKDDFFTVIDNKVKDWKGTEWEKYLRPDTLFRASKFQGYLNEKPAEKKHAGSKEGYSVDLSKYDCL